MGKKIAGKSRKAKEKGAEAVEKKGKTAKEETSTEEKMPEPSSSGKKTEEPKTAAAAPVVVLGQKLESMDLPFERIEKHPQFPNCRIELPAIGELMTSIQEVGLLEPLTVWGLKLEEPKILPSGEEVREVFYLISGFRRHAAIYQLRMKTPEILKEIPVNVFRGPIERAILINMTENIQRENPNPVEIGGQIILMRDSYGFTLTEIASFLGKSKTWVSFAVKMAEGKEVTAQLKEAVNDGLLNYWVAVELAKKEPKEQIRMVSRLREAMREGKTEEEIEEIKEEIRKETKKRRRMRSVGEIRDAFEHWSQMEENGLKPNQVYFLRGMLKALHYVQNNEVDFKDINKKEWEESVEE